MTVNEIRMLFERLRIQDENISLPFVTFENGTKKIECFTYSSEDIDDMSMIIDRIKRKMVIDPETNDYVIEDVEKDENSRIDFEDDYDLEEMDALYKSYYYTLQEYVDGSASIEEVNDALKKFTPESFVDVYKRQGMMTTEQEEKENGDDESLEDFLKKGTM